MTEYQVDSYQLVSTDNGNDGKWLDTHALRIEVDKPILGALVSKDHIRVDVRIDIADTFPISSNDAAKGRLALCIG